MHSLKALNIQRAIVTRNCCCRFVTDSGDTGAVHASINEVDYYFVGSFTQKYQTLYPEDAYDRICAGP